LLKGLKILQPNW